MPYAAGHRAVVKKNIVDSARKLFNRHGFESVSIQQIMSGAGLTPGGFYSYFKNKSDLYAEVPPASSPTLIGKVVGKA
jgi:AcrR family transcriptional regulator